MPLTHLTQEDIDTYKAQRARLEPIAAACGVAFDEDNHRLMQALETISYEQRGGAGKRGASMSSGPTGPLEAQARQFVAGLDTAVKSTSRTGERRDLGDRVADLFCGTETKAK